MNNRYKTLLDIECKKLISSFEDSRKLFFNSTNKNNLHHGPEYGSYRERACKDFLKFILPNKYKTGDGFVINSYDETTSQCDLVIYNSNLTPMIEVNQNTRFFPCETTLAIGEVKSVLNKKELFNCLKKLALNKEIRKLKSHDIIDGTIPSEDFFNSGTEFIHPFTFVICESILGFSNNLAQEIEHFYISEKIPLEFRHNYILSLKDGYISYIFDDNLISELLSIENPHPKASRVINALKNTTVFYPKYVKFNIPIYIFQSNNFEHFYNFSTSLNNFLINAITFYPDPIHYIYND
ncbi:MAG: hypothetical protein RR556_03125 [Cetobacterium sp.]